MTDPRLYYAILCRLEILLAYSANRAYPILRDVLESCAGCDSAIGITDFGVIFVAAKSAYILLHNSILLGLWYRPILHFFMLFNIIFRIIFEMARPVSGTGSVIDAFNNNIVIT